MVIVQLITDNREPFRQYERKIPWFGTAPEALLQGMSEIPELEVHVVSCLQKPVISPEKIAPNIWYHGLHVPKIGWMRTGYQGCIRAVRRKLREIQPDIVHGQGTERDCALSAVFSGFPNVLTIHGNIRRIAQVNQARPFSFHWLAAKLEGFTVPRSNGVVCITNYTRDAMAKLARQTWVIPNAVDASFFDVSHSPKAPPIILYVGTILFLKNQNDFIRALDPLAESTQFKIIFLGGAGENDPYAMEFFQLLKTRPWCIYEGFADREKLKTHFAQATMLVLPSKEDNCPMVVLEAMAVGIPVMAAKVGGIPELIEESKTGIFCDPLDASSMRNGVKHLLANFSLRQQISRQAKADALKRFHPKIIAQRHLEIYSEVLNKPL